jgi:intracellular septation protein A
METVKTSKKENPFINLLMNVIIPSFVLIKLSEPDKLGAVYGLLVALAFPLAYGLKELWTSKKVNFLSVLGLVSILLTGILGLLNLDAQWIAVKEASVPLLIGMAVLVSLKTKYPLVEKLLLNDQVFNIPLINEALERNLAQNAFKELLKKSSYMVAGSFLVSALLNYGLAKYLLVSPPGTPAFNEELGRMTALSFPVIAVPSTLIMFVALWYLVKKLGELTQLTFEQMFEKK